MYDPHKVHMSKIILLKCLGCRDDSAKKMIIGQEA